MKILWGALVVDGRNKIGGHVASKNHFGAYLRTKVTPSNPQTPAQSAARNRLLDISALWKTLDNTEISIWENVLPNWKKSDIFGNSHAMTAINLFQKLNNNIIRAGGTEITAPPAPVALSDVGDVSLVWITATSLTVQATLNTLGTNEFFEVFATPKMISGKRFIKSEYRLIGSQFTTSGGAVVITTAYIAKYGAIPAGPGRVYIKIRILNSVTGQATIPVSAFAEL